MASCWAFGQFGCGLPSLAKLIISAHVRAAGKVLNLLRDLRRKATNPLGQLIVMVTYLESLRQENSTLWHARVVEPHCPDITCPYLAVLWGNGPFVLPLDVLGDGAISVQQISTNKCASVFPSLLTALWMVGASVTHWEPSVIDPVPRGAVILPKDTEGTQPTTLLTAGLSHTDRQLRRSKQLVPTGAGASLAMKPSKGCHARWLPPYKLHPASI